MIAKKHTNERDIDTSVFYLFKIENKDMVLFAGDMSYPIRHGKINTVAPILQYFKNKLGKNFKLYQFDKSDRDGFAKDYSPIRVDDSSPIKFPTVGFPVFPVRKFIPKTNRDKIYYHFKLEASKHILFDSAMDSSIQYGSKIEVNAQYRNMPADATVYYLEKNNTNGFKMKMTIKPDKRKKSSEKVKATAQEQSDKK